MKSLFHWKVLLNLLLAAAVFLGLVWLTFRWLEFHTNHGKEIAVPNVMNMTVQNAIKELDDAGLDYEVDSFKYDPKFKPYQVLQIYPSPGSHVKNGRAIILKVNPRTWAKVVVPDILDRYKGLAFRQLDQVGLKVGDTIYEPSIQRDAVIRMQYGGTVLKPGSLLPRFSVIDLVIGTGPKRNISVPNLVGLTVAEAKALIAQNLFEAGLVEHEDGRQDDADIVYYQDPEGGAIRDQGMQIDLWASKKLPAQMSAKIAELDATYRVKLDTTAPPPVENVPAYTTPPPTVQHHRKAPAVTEDDGDAADEPVKPKMRATPKSSEPKSAEPKQQQPAEKPKKKIIVE